MQEDEGEFGGDVALGEGEAIVELSQGCVCVGTFDGRHGESVWV